MSLEEKNYLNEYKSIAIGLDNQILFQVETVIKLIVANTSDVRFYLFNNDIPRQ